MNIKKQTQRALAFTFSFSLFLSLQTTQANAPRLTVIFIIDQLNQNYIQDLKKHFTGGLKYLVENGANYTQAYFPHASPGTAIGHAALNTGTFARYHGIVGNSWRSQGKTIYAGKDPAQKETLPQVDGITDQYIIAETPNIRRHAFALSAKERAAVMLAGQTGKAFWFDQKTGNITTNRYYYETLPNWIADFNAGKNLHALESATWELAYSETSPAYAQATKSDYNLTSEKAAAGKTVTIDHHSATPFNVLYKHPYIDKLLLELAQDCIKAHLDSPENQLLLWVSLSALDPIAHLFGPRSREAIDTVYHLDKELQNFFESVWQKIDKKETVFVLTADHGGMPIVEKLQQKGYKSARRINPNDLIKKVNKAVFKQHTISEIVYSYKNAQLFLNETLLRTHPPQKQLAILKTIQKTVKNMPGIKAVWTGQELDRVTNKKIDPFKYTYAQQRYPGRVGHLFIQPQPYTIITKWETGTGHKSPYNYDTHVPLILFQPGVIEKKVITRNVSPLQLAPTVAQIMEIPRPSATQEKVLPFLFSEQK